MKNYNSGHISKKVLKLMRVEVFHSLADRYGSQQKMESNPTEQAKMDFQVDRLFSIFHIN